MLLLDRDGVLNELLPGDYVKNWNEFKFRTGVLEGLSKLANAFTYIFIITNQQGIGKHLMSEEDLIQIHNKMLNEIRNSGGRIDHIAYCPHLASENCTCRKPKTGMVEMLFNKFPKAKSSRVYLLGDSASDFELGQSLGAVCFGMRHANNKDQNWNSYQLMEVDSFMDFQKEILKFTE